MNKRHLLDCRRQGFDPSLRQAKGVKMGRFLWSVHRSIADIKRTGISLTRSVFLYRHNFFTHSLFLLTWLTEYVWNKWSKLLKSRVPAFFSAVRSYNLAGEIVIQLPNHSIHHLPTSTGAFRIPVNMRVNMVNTVPFDHVECLSAIPSFPLPSNS